MGLFATIVVGLVAGLLASYVMKVKTGLMLDLVLGVIGGFLGGWITSLVLGVNLMSGINLTSLVVAFLGAILAIYLYGWISRRR